MDTDISGLSEVEFGEIIKYELQNPPCDISTYTVKYNVSCENIRFELTSLLKFLGVVSGILEFGHPQDGYRSYIDTRIRTSVSELYTNAHQLTEARDEIIEIVDKFQIESLSSVVCTMNSTVVKVNALIDKVKHHHDTIMSQTDKASILNVIKEFNL